MQNQCNSTFCTCSWLTSTSKTVHVEVVHVSKAESIVLESSSLVCRGLIVKTN